MLRRKQVIIPETILQPLFTFLRYTLLGTRHLNKFTAGIYNENPVIEPLPVASRKRKRIIQQLAEGPSLAKKRKFPLSWVKEALRGVSLGIVEDQVRILESHAVVVRPTKRSVQLVRAFSDRARAYMIGNCAFTYAEIANVEEDAAALTD